MSVMRRLLNTWLRTVEKRRLQTGTPKQLRRALEVQSRLLFHAPRGTKSAWRTFGDVPCLEVVPRGSVPDRVLFFIHGGGFVFGSPDTHSAMAANLAQRLGARAILPKYRCAPDFVFPVAPNDIRSAWDALIASGVAAKDIVIGGDSAGGALAFGLIAGLNAEALPMPGSVFGLSPLTDLAFEGDSHQSNASRDVILPAERAAEMAEMFLDGHDAKEPSVSPLYGDFRNGPAAWITVGNTEILFDDAQRLAQRLEAQDVDVTLVVEDDLPHVWPVFHNILPEARHTLALLAQWIKRQQNWEA